MFAETSQRRAHRQPPRLVPNPEFPVRPCEGRFGMAALRFLGRGVSPSPFVPPMTWMQANGATDENDLERIRLAFAGQLGPAWRGFAHASVITKVLLLRAAACFHGGDLLKQIDADLMAIMASPASLPSDMFVIRSVANRYGSDARLVDWIDSITEKHGFERTALIGAIRHVVYRKGMVALGTRDVPWLPYVDRTSWIAIHFWGWKVVAAECAGIFSHLLAEQTAGHALMDPQIEPAVDGIRSAWRERLVFDAHEGEWIRAEGLHS